MRLEQAKRLKKLEKENSRLKRLVAVLSLDNAILKEAAGGTYKPVQETPGDHPLQLGKPSVYGASTNLTLQNHFTSAHPISRANKRSSPDLRLLFHLSR